MEDIKSLLPRHQRDMDVRIVTWLIMPRIVRAIKQVEAKVFESLPQLKLLPHLPVMSAWTYDITSLPFEVGDSGAKTQCIANLRRWRLGGDTAKPLLVLRDPLHAVEHAIDFEGQISVRAVSHSILQVHGHRTCDHERTCQFTNVRDCFTKVGDNRAIDTLLTHKIVLLHASPLTCKMELRAMPFIQRTKNLHVLLHNMRRIESQFDAMVIHQDNNKMCPDMKRLWSYYLYENEHCLAFENPVSVEPLAYLSILTGAIRHVSSSKFDYRMVQHGSECPHYYFGLDVLVSPEHQTFDGLVLSQWRPPRQDTLEFYTAVQLARKNKMPDSHMIHWTLT